MDTAGDTVGFIVSSHMNFLAPLSFPSQVDAAFRVARLGTSSVAYDVAIFPPDGDAPAATGGFVHVFVDTATQRPVPIAPAVRKALEAAALPRK